MFPDISEFQGAVDWSALKTAYDAGIIEAVSMRSSFGTVRADAQFAQNQRQCRAAGIPAIYYHFCYPTYNAPQTEAQFFNGVIGPLGPNEAMMGDFEDDPQSASVFPRGQAGIQWASAFLSALQAPQNATWFYTYTSLFEAVGMSPLLATWPFVWADYSTRQDNPFGAIARQFTDCGATPGVAGCCDQNNVLKAPLGQWLTQGDDMFEDPDRKMLSDLYQLVVQGNPRQDAFEGQGWIKVGVDQILGQTGTDPANSLAAIRGAVAQPPPINVVDLAAALAPHLPPAVDPQVVAVAVAELVGRRLTG